MPAKTSSVQSGVRVQALQCPACQGGGQQLSQDDGTLRWQCKSCEAQYILNIACDACSAEVDRLVGCGAPEEYFCRACRSQRARRAVIYTLSPCP